MRLFKSRMSLSSLITRYIEHKKTNSKLSKASHTNLGWAMALLEKELGELSLGQLDAVLISSVEQTLKQQDGSRYSPSSHSPISKNWKAFFRWLHKQNYTKKNLGTLIRSYDSVGKGNKLPAPEKLAAVRAAIVPYSRNTRLSALRDSVVVSMIDEGGMRRRALHELEVKAAVAALDNKMNLFGREMYVSTSISKGEEEVLISFGERTARLLDRYLDRRGLNGSPYLFANKHNVQVSKTTISYAFKRISEYAGVRPVIFSHAFRHQYITDLLLNGVDVKTIAILSNHKNEQIITRHYAHVGKLDALKAAAKMLNKRDGEE